MRRLGLLAAFGLPAVVAALAYRWWRQIDRIAIGGGR